MGQPENVGAWSDLILRPTRVRYGVLALTTLMAILLYLDRVCIAAAGPLISAELGLDKVEMGFVYGSFFFAYALAQVPAGWLGDRLGARAMLTACVLGWSLFTGLTALAVGLATLAAVRLLFGVSQAGAYPIAARVNSVWMPFAQRALASSIITLGGRAGGALAYPLTAVLIAALGDWRSPFLIYALFGAAWAACFWAWFRTTPAQHPACNPAEVRLIESGLPANATNPRGQARTIPWAAALRSRSLWMQCATQFASNIPWAFLVTWLPTYLAEVHEVKLEEGGVLAALPLVGGVCGCLVGGIATDYLTRRLGLRWGRSLLGSASKFLAAAGMGMCMVANEPLLAALALTFMSFTMDTGLGATWAYFQDAGGSYVGTLLGWANMFGNLGAFLSPMLLGWLATAYGWNVALAVCAAFFVLSGVCWFWINPCVPIVPGPTTGEPAIQR